MNKCSNCGCEFEGNFCIECGTKYIGVVENNETTQSFNYSKDIKKDSLKKLLKWSLFSLELLVFLITAFIFIALNADLEALNSPLTAVLPLLLLVLVNIGFIILCKCAFDWDKDKLDKRKLYIAGTILITAIILIPIIRAINISLWNV